MTIRAFAASSPKSPLEPFSYPRPKLGPFEVLIQITHCGLCYSDVHLIDDDWKRSKYPLVPGHEVVGTVIEKGAEARTELGARVGVSWYRSACLECPYCLVGETPECPDKKWTCLGHHGGFATEMTADSRFIHPIPEGLSSEVAAPLLCAGATVYAPLRRLKVQAPDRVAILGIGGLGHLAIQFAHAFGCTVTAISSSPNKKEEALRFGATHFVTLDQITKAPKEWALKFDYIFSTAHANLDWNLICSLLKCSGTLCLLGRAPSSIQLDPLTSLATPRIVTGSTVANRFLINEMLSFAAEHKIAPQIERMKLSQINEAIAKLRKNQVRYRIVLSV